MLPTSFVKRLTDRCAPMADYGPLFILVLAAQTLLVIVVLGIIYALIQGDRKKKSRATEHAVVAVARECPYFFGYLAQQPRSQPIPGECFGCQLSSECKHAVTMEVTIRRKKR